MFNFFEQHSNKARSMRVNYGGFTLPKSAVLKVFLAAVAIVFCLFYGAAFAFLVPSSLVLIIIPIVIIFLFIIWALPDATGANIKITVAVFYCSVVSSYVWPNYLAIHLMGLPWITVSRLIGYPLLLLCLINISTNRNFRSTIWGAMMASKLLSTLITMFLVIQICSVFMSSNKSMSLDKLAVTGITYAWMVVGIYVFLRQGEISRLFNVLWGVAAFVGIIGVWQYKIKHLPWAGHIPAFLDVNNPALMKNLLYGVTRAFTNQYRVNSVFSTSLGLAEYMALIFPFVIYFAFGRRPLYVRLLAVLTLPAMMLVVVITGARIGMIGCLMSICIYPAIIGIRRWRNDPSSIVGPAISLAYPIISTAAILSTFFVGRLKDHIWGGGAQAASTMSRTEQLRMAIPLVLRNPLGYGIGRGAETLNYQPFGFVTIDSYYILIMLEFGVFGFIIYYSIILVGIFKAAKIALSSSYLDSEQGLAAPIFISLFVFFIIKSVFSQPDNVGLVSLMLVMLIALNQRTKASSLGGLGPTGAPVLGASTLQDGYPPDPQRGVSVR
jgi:hypothetical protein